MSVDELGTRCIQSKARIPAAAPVCALLRHARPIRRVESGPHATVLLVPLTTSFPTSITCFSHCSLLLISRLNAGLARRSLHPKLSPSLIADNFQRFVLGCVLLGIVHVTAWLLAKCPLQQGLFERKMERGWLAALGANAQRELFDSKLFPARQTGTTSTQTRLIVHL